VVAPGVVMAFLLPHQFDEPSNTASFVVSRIGARL
jgi:hypothetical protein